MKTLNSLSGGATSSYMALNFPADYNVFALVCIDYEPARPKDAALVQWVNDKLQRHSMNKSEFIATAEDVRTLIAVRDLEQRMGREIAWVRGLSFDQMIQQRKSLPNSFKRFCTSILKIEPIRNHVLYTIKEPVLMQQGIRADEEKRQKDGWAQIYVDTLKEIVDGKEKRRKVGWAIASYPLIENRVFYPTVKQWKETSGLIFPENSNCSHCFWKSSQELRQNFETNPHVIEWARQMEQQRGHQWKKEISIEAVMQLGLQLGFQFDLGMGCNAGFCTN